MNDLLSAFPLKEPESYISVNVLGFSIHGFRKLLERRGGTGEMIRPEKKGESAIFDPFFLKMKFNCGG